MISVDKAVLARVKKDGKEFEILVDCDKALDLKEGKSVSIDDVLVANKVFKDSKKGLAASEHDIKQIFKTNDVRTIAKIIIKEGEVQLTAEHKHKIREQIRKKIINIIHTNAIDSQTKLPHPPARIERAMEEAKVHIDENKTAEEQVEKIVEKLRAIIPIKFEKKEIIVKIPAKYIGNAHFVVKKYAEVLKEEWQSNGSLVFLTRIPAGLTEEYFNELNKLTHGEVETKEV